VNKAELIDRVAGAADRDEHTDPLPVESSSDVLDRLRRRRIEPLRIVDGDHDRRLHRQSAQQAEQPDRNRSVTQRRTVAAPPQQRDLDGVALRGRQLGEEVFG